ncbi:MAG: lamin tail domain-containing protein [Ignavibacteriales bacterium]|nr:lamin tail domain-containing protein [Ignavibacteriales bacterium]
MIKNISFLLFLLINLSYAQTDTLLILSEVMFSPTSGNNEFIEIYNLSSTQTVDLNGYNIKYYTSAADQIVDAGFGTTLPPNTYAIIFENDYDISTGIYSGLVPSSALILKIADNSFGGTGMANTTSRPLWLLDVQSDSIDYYFYSANNSTAISDEKKILNRDSLQTNWANSLVTNGTPGFTNSVTPTNYDLQLSSLTFSPLNPIVGNDVTVSAKVKNNGILNAVSYSIEIFNDINKDSIADVSERIFNQSYSNLASNDSVTASTVLNSLPADLYQIIAQVNYAEDQNFTNNVLIKRFTVSPPGNNFNDIVINEIMYAPSSGEPEWIEIFNRTSNSINLKNWKFSDASTTITVTNEDRFIDAYSFLIISSDSSILNYYNVSSPILITNIPSLNNTGDNIVLKDFNNLHIDSVSYLPTWGGNINGKSLERISVDALSNNSTNWGSSVSLDKATPGKINSITPKDYDLRITSFESENEFGIIGEEIQLNVVVKNIGLNTSSNFNINLYRDANADSIAQLSELISTQQGSALNAGDSLNYNFTTSDFITGNNLFMAFVDVIPDNDSTNNIAFKTITGVSINEERNDIVINEIMYAPNSPQPEWIEIYNRSNKVIDLKNYQIADAADTIKIISQSTILNPNEFFIVTKDSLIFNYYNINSNYVISSFPTLNNSDDRLILLDSLNRVIDSLYYSSAWGGSNNKSLERVDVNSPSTDSSNWKTSKSIFNATPGTYNSVTQKDFDLLADDILFTPKFPLVGETVSVSAFVKNIGKNSAAFSIDLYEDTDLDSIPDTFIETISNLNLAVNDSASYQFSYLIQSLLIKKAFYVKVFFEQDQDTTNNSFYKTIEPGFPNQTIVVNEIMFAPFGGEPEWIELYNNSDVDINLKDWTVSDVVTTPVKATIQDDFIIPANGYVVVAKDSSITNYHRFISSPILELNLPSFNNDQDGVVLKDNRGIAIDSVLYSNQWGGTSGFSLERISSANSSNNQLNWGSSSDIEQSTPGRINSITSKEFDLSVSEISFSPRFPILGEDVSISAKIKNNGNQTAQSFLTEFYIDTDSNNVADLLLSSVNSSNLNSGDSISINSTTQIIDLQKKILAAVRVVFVSDEDSLNNYFEKSVEPGFAENIIKINEVMYSPADGNPEWVELVNASSDSINIKNWFISDVLSSPTKNIITNDDLFIEPNEIFIIAKDTSFNSAHPNTISKIFYTNFGSLGNTSDGVVIYDFRNGIIDSLFYSSSWGGKKGYSLERISLNEQTNDSTNWVTSLDESGSTPGLENSIYSVPAYERNDLVINEIMYDPETNNSEYVEFYNLSSDPVNIGGWKFEDENGNTNKLIETSFVIQPKEYFVLAADSSAIVNYNLFEYENKNIIGESSLGLVNTGELILLKDVRGNVIDSVFYSDDWNNKNIASTQNKSLERINPSLDGNDPLNWSTSVNSVGGTPGNQNSIFAENLNQSANISVNPNPFSPDNDGFEDFTIINYNLTQATAQVRIKIFDSKGRLVRTLLNNQASGSTGSVIFDGLDDENNALRMGIYIIFLEALNDNSGIVETIKSTVVVARKL